MIVLIIQIIFRILDIYLISISDHIVHPLLLILVTASQAWKTLSCQIKLIHSNFLPVVLVFNNSESFSKDFKAHTSCL